MSSAATKPWTQEQFLDWVETQDGRYEFDGFRPVAMHGGNANHERICQNIHFALRSRLRGTGCSSFGPTFGITTTGTSIRYPDALITCTKFPGTDRLAPYPVIVFEVISPTSGREDRVVKLREYQGVASIRRYVILESTSAAVTVLERLPDGAWKDIGLTEEDTLALPEVGLEIPVAELYEDIEFPTAGVSFP
jgi:Uma2 family endonuclease